MTTGGLSKARLARMHTVMASYVESGHLSGLVTLVSRRGETHVDAIGTLAADSTAPMRRDTLFRIASLSKPIAATAAMILVEECKLRLDEPVHRLLPELADRRVLRRLDGPLDDTVPANRPLSLRDLLTLRMGMGFILAPDTDDYPIQQALKKLGLLQGPSLQQSQPAPDEWMRRVGSLPLMRQPGEEWMYDLGLDVLGVLIARAADQPLDVFMRERLFEPLGMHDTGFSVPSEKLNRLASCYQTNPQTKKLDLFDGPTASQWATPPTFPSAAGGLVSTVDDYLVFCQMLLNRGKHGNQRILSRLSVEAMTTDQLTAEQRANASVFLENDRGWGLGMSVIVQRDHAWAVPGRFGWDGGLGTSAYTDPTEDMIGILMTQRIWDAAEPPWVMADFWTAAYQAIDD